MTRVTDLRPDDQRRIHQAAETLVDAFRGNPHGWPDLPAALAEVRESLAEGRLSLVALDAASDVSGWIGGIRQYDGNAWELHPLAVRRQSWRRGVGRTLVAALEARAREQGAALLWLTTDDAMAPGRTNLYGVDLWPDVLGRLATIRDTGGHPLAFYLKQGFVVTGVLPDAYGPGKPEVVMAKRVGNQDGSARDAVSRPLVRHDTASSVPSSRPGGGGRERLIPEE